MKNNKRTWKQFATQLVTLAIVLSLVAGITKPRQAQAVDYGLKNPTIDSNGVAHGTAYALETIGRMILMVTELLTKMIRNSQLNGGCYR